MLKADKKRQITFIKGWSYKIDIRKYKVDCQSSQCLEKCWSTESQTKQKKQNDSQSLSVG